MRKDYRFANVAEARQYADDLRRRARHLEDVKIALLYREWAITHAKAYPPNWSRYPNVTVRKHTLRKREDELFRELRALVVAADLVDTAFDPVQ